MTWNELQSLLHTVVAAASTVTLDAYAYGADRPEAPVAEVVRMHAGAILGLIDQMAVAGWAETAGGGVGTGPGTDALFGGGR